MPRVPNTDLSAAKIKAGGLVALIDALSEHTEAVRLILNGALSLDANANAQVIKLPRIDVPVHREVGATNEPAFANSWVNFDATEATYSKVRFWLTPAGLVGLLGYAKSGTISTTSTGTIFTLPAGYRPNKDIEIGTVAARAGVEVRATLYIDSSGNVRAHVVDGGGALDWLSLSGVSFLNGLTQPAGWSGKGFPLRIQSRVKDIVGVVPLGARSRTAGEMASFAVDWEPTDDGFRVKAFPGLSPGGAYSVSLLVLGGG